MCMELKWLTGLTLYQCEKMDYTWFFRFSEDATIATEAPWRLIGDRILVTSEDHGHLFGLDAPVDAVSRVLEAVRDKAVTSCQVRGQTGDLSVAFGTEGLTIEFLQPSAGYEAWRASKPGVLIICMGGGEIDHQVQ